MNPEPADRQPSLADELARERNREAADRTLLAWIRTSLSMISFGFGIERLGEAAMAFDGRIERFATYKTRAAGAALILLGVAATLAGFWEHKRVVADLTKPGFRYSDRAPIARYLAIVVVLLGMAAMGLILVRF
jgi:putative membrane protein